jgi:hypothetical protein
MLYQALAFSNYESCGDSPLVITEIQSPIVSSDGAVQQCCETALQMAKLARLLDIPANLAKTSPLVPLCFFVAGRYLLVTKISNWDHSGDIIALKRGLTHLATMFPIAGISLLFSN